MNKAFYLSIAMLSIFMGNAIYAEVQMTSIADQAKIETNKVIDAMREKLLKIEKDAQEQPLTEGELFKLQLKALEKKDQALKSARKTEGKVSKKSPSYQKAQAVRYLFHKQYELFKTTRILENV